MSDDPIAISMDDLTLGEMADALEACNVADPEHATGADQLRATAALAWVTRRRSDPTFTYADALALPVGAIVQVDDANPLALAASNGARRPASRARGRSTRAK